MFSAESAPALAARGMLPPGLLTIASSGDSQRLAPQVTAVLRALMPYRRLPETQDIFDIARAAGLKR